VNDTPNIYRIDDLLLKGARLTALLIPVGLTALMQYVARTDLADAPSPAGIALISAALTLCPLSLWLAGRHVRSAEKRILALHELLQKRRELPASTLIGDAGFTRTELKRAIRLLNAERVGYYVWDARTDSIRDALVPQALTGHARCPACGASFSFSLSDSAEALPACTYCQTPVGAETLDALRRAALEGAAKQDRAAPPGAPGSKPPRPFSLPIFALLLVLCWPAAVVYAVMRSRVSTAA